LLLAAAEAGKGAWAAQAAQAATTLLFKNVRRDSDMMEKLLLCNRYLSCDGIFRLPALFALGHEPDGAGGAVFAVYSRVPAGQALFAKIEVVLHAEKTALDFRMTRALGHGGLLLFLRMAALGGIGNQRFPEPTPWR
jgi:hypothetical protein